MFALKSLSRIAVLAVLAGSIALTAIPAQAAPTLGGSLSLGAPAAPQVQQDAGGGTTTMMKKQGYDYDYDYDDCDEWGLTNKEIRKGLKKAGFAEIDFVKELKKHRVRVEALYEDDGWVYSMRIDRCDGEVDQIKPLYESDSFDIDF